MTDFSVLRSGGWYDTELSGIKKGEQFKVALPTVVGTDNNPIGEDIYTALADARLESGQWIVDIEKPAQSRWSSDYLDDLTVRGISIQVRGSTKTEFRQVSG